MKIWYVGDSFVDYTYGPKGLNPHGFDTGWIRRLPGVLGVGYDNRCACAGSAPDWAVRSLIERWHEIQPDDVCVFSVADFSRLDLKCHHETPDLHARQKDRKHLQHVFRELHNRSWDLHRTWSTVSWIHTAVAYKFSRVLLLTPFGIPVVKGHPSLGKISSTNPQVFATMPVRGNIWWYPRAISFYTLDPQFTAPGVVDPRPNHLTNEQSDSMLRSATEWFQEGKTRVYSPFKKIPEPQYSINTI